MPPVVLLFGCGPAAREASVLPPERTQVALNSVLVISLDGPVDPLSVTLRSVSIERDDGRALDAEVETAGGRILARLVVDQELIDQPPEAVSVRLEGWPSPHALSLLDGRRLGSPRTLSFRVARLLEPAGSQPPRLVSLDGQPPRPGLELSPAGPLWLVLDGVLDPATIGPEACPLLPLEQGLVLATPIRPVTAWRCIGARFELSLGLDAEHGRLQLDLRRFGWRDLSGGIPEPALVAEIVAR
jgi:hypothetical protein